MNTKTMRLPPRRVLTPDKRKEPDRVTKLPTTSTPFKPLPKLASAGGGAKNKPVVSNQLLAGYLAHEFLTKGTLLGEPWSEAAQAEAVQKSALTAKPVRGAELLEPSERAADLKRRRYEDVSRLLRADGTQLPGIVNPAQLARFLKL